MAGTVTLTCPECDKQMKAPETVLGKKVRCKGCGAVFAAAEDGEIGLQPEPLAPKAPPKKSPPKQASPAKAPASKPAPAPAAKKSDDEEDASAYGVNTDYLGARCPECANAMESEDAIICLHCGYNTMTRIKARRRKVQEQTGMDYFIWLLPGIATAIGIVLIITFDVVYCLMIEDWIDKEAWYSFLSSLGTKIWIVVPTLFIMFGMGKFAVKRLIFDNKPPEIEEKL